MGGEMTFSFEDVYKKKKDKIKLFILKKKMVTLRNIKSFSPYFTRLPLRSGCRRVVPYNSP